MPDYQRPGLVRYFPNMWRTWCPCGRGETGWRWRDLLDSLLEHGRACPALRLQRLLADLEAEARSSEVMSLTCRDEASTYGPDQPDRSYWDAWTYAHAANATHLRGLAEKYREAPDA